MTTTKPKKHGTKKSTVPNNKPKVQKLTGKGVTVLKSTPELEAKVADAMRRARS